MKKGITPIIAVIILLLITVALAGMAWAFLSGYFTGMTAKNIQLIDYSCAGGTTRVIFRNAGTQTIDITTPCTTSGSVFSCGDLTVVKTEGAVGTGTRTIEPAANINKGTTATFIETLAPSGTNTYRFTTPTGAAGPSPNVATVNC